MQDLKANTRHEVTKKKEEKTMKNILERCFERT